MLARTSRAPSDTRTQRHSVSAVDGVGQHAHRCGRRVRAHPSQRQLGKARRRRSASVSWFHYPGRPRRPGAHDGAGVGSVLSEAAGCGGQCARLPMVGPLLHAAPSIAFAIIADTSKAAGEQGGHEPSGYPCRAELGVPAGGAGARGARGDRAHGDHAPRSRTAVARRVAELDTGDMTAVAASSTCRRRPLGELRPRGGCLGVLEWPLAPVPSHERDLAGQRSRLGAVSRFHAEAIRARGWCGSLICA